MIWEGGREFLLGFGYEIEMLLMLLRMKLDLIEKVWTRRLNADQSNRDQRGFKIRNSGFGNEFGELDD